MFIRNVGLLSTKYTTALYPALRRRLLVGFPSRRPGFELIMWDLWWTEAASRVLSEYLGNRITVGNLTVAQKVSAFCADNLTAICEPIVWTMRDP
jgi:hypothetical protein